MAIFQGTFHIPDKIMAMIDAKEYKLDGGVVRNNKGEIKYILKPVSLKKAILLYSWENRDTIIKLAKLGKLGVQSYIMSKKKREPDVDVKFREALDVYLNAVRKGVLTMEIITDMMERLDELKKHPNSKKNNFVFSMEELDVLLNIMFEYTKKLGADNAIELTSLEEETPSQSKDPYINLQRCLETQRRIFQMAA